MTKGSAAVADETVVMRLVVGWVRETPSSPAVSVHHSDDGSAFEVRAYMRHIMNERIQPWHSA